MFSSLKIEIRTIADPMNSAEKNHSRKRLREAEGYVELLFQFDKMWPLDRGTRRMLAARALECLDAVDPAHGYIAHTEYLRGQAHRGAGRLKTAIKHFNRSIEFDDWNTSAYLSAAWCYRRANQLDMAVQTLERALNVDENDAVVHFNLACYLALAAQPKTAVEHLATAFELEFLLRALECLGTHR